MDAEQVVKKILSDAQSQAEEIRKQAEGKELNEQAKFNSQLNEYKKQTGILAKKNAEEKKSHLLAAARMEISKELLAEKRKILDEVFEQASSRLQNLPDEQYHQLMSKLMLAAVESGDEEVIVDNNEKRIDQKFINQMNQQLSSSGKGNLKLSIEKQSLGGGFVLRRGKVKNNVSLKILLMRARKELEIELAKELFEN